MKTILITGASDGIGKSIATKLSKGQNNLILFGRDEQKLKSVQEICEKNGSTVEIYAFDLNDNETRQKVVKEILQNHQIDILINNAGIWHKAGDLTTLGEDKITEVINTNLTSQILLTRELLDSMRQRENSAIVNVISKSGLMPQLGQTVYTASKFGMKGFTDVLRLDTKADPIRIAGVYQSGTNTEMFAKAGEEFSTEKFTNPDDLADVVAFILSQPDRIWINEIHVDH